MTNLSVSEGRGQNAKKRGTVVPRSDFQSVTTNSIDNQRIAAVSLADTPAHACAGLRTGENNGVIVQLELFDNVQKQVDNTMPKKKNAQTETSLDVKIERALRLLRSAAACDTQPIEVSYSGGKDSDVILELVRMAGIPYRAIYKNTTIDPPGTIKHCKDMDVKIARPKKNFAQVIQEKGFPNRFRRFCCSELKEYKILDRSVQGIRKLESIKRKMLYKEPTVCRLYGSKKQRVEVFLPILDWTEKDVAEFIKLRGIRCHPLYYDEEGKFHPERRLGCMGCPQSTDNGLHDFKQYPLLVKMWLRNGEIWWNTHKLEKTKRKFKSHYEVFVHNVFFHDFESFNNAIHGMFGNIDCKEFLEQYFCIKL